VSRPILVTGAHRSGTTWVGKMLALAPGVGYVHEPFNPATPGSPFTRYYERVADEAYARPLERALEFKPGLRRLPHDPRALRDALRRTRSRLRGARPLVKDPIALRSADWLADRFGMSVVVTIRHPAGFVSSVRRLGWEHDFSTFAGDERLARFEPELRSVPDDPLDRAALLWRILYSLVERYRDEHPDWILVRHEDASRAPLPTFEHLYGVLGLELTPRARRKIESHSSSRNPVEASHRHAVRLDSAAAVDRWRSRLSPAEIGRVREATRDVWPSFYADEDW